MIKIYSLAILVILFSICFCENPAQYRVTVSDLYEVLGITDADITFDMYAGFMPLTNIEDKELYFWYMTQDNTTVKSNKTILWMNGGPGCSSLGGATSEVGPFSFEELQPKNETKGHLNPYSWNKLANLLFIEFPLGVGFSSSTTDTQDDVSTAINNYNALLGIFSTFTELQTTELYIIGESYAGVYVPSLAHRIHLENEKLEIEGKNKIINFKGYATGNPCTDESFECNINNQSFWTQMTMLFEMGVISKDQYVTWESKCLIDGDISTENYSADCGSYEENILNNIGLAYNGKGPYLNYYDVFRKCAPPYKLTTGETNSVENDQKSTFEYHIISILKSRQKKFAEAYKNEGKTSQIKNSINEDPGCVFPVGEGSPCVESTGADHFFNKQSIRDIININPLKIPTTFKWSDCTGAPRFKFQKTNGSYWIHKEFATLQKNYRIMVYSGNTDLAVPITGTKEWINKLRKEISMQIVQPMKRWQYTDNLSEKQVGGFFEIYDKFSFVEFQGVGHMVPQWAPQATFCAISKYLNDSIYDIEDCQL